MNNHALMLSDQGRHREAISIYDQIVTLDPSYAKAFNNKGRALREMGRLEKAVATFDQAISVNPDYVIALVNRSESLCRLKLYDRALNDCDRAIAINPDFPEAHCYRGNALRWLRRVDEAIASYDRAIALKPSYAEAFNNRGTAYLDHLRHDEALSSFRAAITQNPDFSDAHLNKSLVHLLTGQFTEGWHEYEWRWKGGGAQELLKVALSATRWTGSEDLSGKTILLHAEQGLGDTIQFCRYAPMVAARGAKVILQVQPQLLSLLYQLTPSSIEGVVSLGDSLPPIDYHCPLLSLPLAFGTTVENIPAPIHLSPDQDKVSQWQSRISDANVPKIGIAWSGRATHFNDQNRSMMLAQMLPALPSECRIFVLQTEIRADDARVIKADRRIYDFSGDLKDFGDTASLMSLMDIVITVDTSIAHLAGTLGKPTWLLLPYAPDWRWLLKSSDSQWYPTMKLFRQQKIGIWDDVVAAVNAELKTVINVS